MCNRFVLFLFCLFVNGILGKIESHNCASTVLTRERSATSYRLCILLDTKTDPCEDFYKFSCGNYIYHKKRMENNSFSITSDVASLNQQHLRHLVKHYATYKITSDRLPINLATDLYKSCMNREKLGLEPMLELIENYGGWPVVKGLHWKETNFIKFIKTILRETFHITPFLRIEHKKVYSRKKLFLEPPTFIMDKEKLLDNTSPYLDLMIDVAVQFGASRSDAEIEMGEVLRLEVDLAWTSGQFKDNVSLTLGEIKSRYPEMMIYMQPSIEPHVAVDSKIILFHPNYFTYLDFTLRKTSPRTIANYLIWRAVVAAASSELLIDELYQRLVTFNKKINGLEYTEDTLTYLDNKCSHYVLKLLPWAADSIYIRDKINLIKNVEAPIMQIKINIENEFIKMIEESTWIDNKAKEKMMMKLKLIDFFIGNLNPSENLKYYKLELNSENFLQNFLSIKQFQRKHRRIPRMSSWEVNARYSMTSWEVDAQCKASDGGIYIPVGALQWPLFSSDAPSYFNYGALGSIIGREFGHAIDVKRHKLDAHGISYHWPSSTEDTYLSRVDCFKRQFSEIKNETRKKLTGEKTINEDISDHLGLKAAYNAYLNVEAATKRLPDRYNLTNRQLFWISMAQSHCGYTSPSQYRQKSSESRQSLNPYRIWGMIKNMPEFGSDFECSRNGKMYESLDDSCELI